MDTKERKKHKGIKMLHTGNKITISESCIPQQLPTGDYHYSLFSHIDVLQQPEKIKKLENLKDKVEELDAGYDELLDENRDLEYRLDRAEELVKEIKQIITLDTNRDQKLAKEILEAIYDAKI